MKKYFFILFALFFIFSTIVEAQTRFQLVYKNKAGSLAINPSYTEPFPVLDSTLVTKLNDLIADIDSMLDAVSGNEFQVDIVAALPAGTNLLGKVGIDQSTANANEVVVKSITAGNNNIGNVDIVSLPTIESGDSTLFSATVLDDSPTADTTDAYFIGDKRKVSFTAYYNETESDTTVQGVLTLQVSPDGTNWYPYDLIFDGSGTDGPVASFTYTADAYDFFYLPEGVTVQYVRAIITGAATDATNTIAFTLIAYWQE